MEFIKNGRFAQYAESVLSSKEYYKEFLGKKMNPAQFRGAMSADISLAEVPGFNKYNIDRISRTPSDEKMPSETILQTLAEHGAAAKRDDICDGFDEYREHIYAHYDHGDFVTYVFPEDERLMYAVSRLRRFTNAFAAGSFYGYLVIWAMKAIFENEGMCVLSDINRDVCDVARKNLDQFGYGDHAKVCCEDAEILLKNRTEPIDLLILDATGKYDDPRPEYRGKRIYGQLFAAVKHVLTKGSVIFVHNMQPENPEMATLVDGLRSIGAVGASYDTYNGLGVYVIA